jgi:shikimate O-hydroxycinnamoyltransferase
MNTLSLAPGDYIFTGNSSSPITFAFVYPTLLDPDVLQRSLQETLVHFPLVRSTLQKVSEQTYGLQCIEKGLSFEVTSSSETFEQVKDRSRFVRFVASVEGAPLTRITLTQTPQGSILGVSISHALVDGFSYFQVLASWARLSQGKRIMPVFTDRELFRPEIRASESVLTPDEVLRRCGVFWENHREELPTGMLAEERVVLPKAKIKEFLVEAKQDADTLLFENDVLTAWLWKHYGMQWNLGRENPLLYITCPVDFRRTLKSEQRLYFGCALCFATAALSYEDLSRASLGDVARLIRSTVGCVTSDYVQEALKTLECLRHQYGIAALQTVHLRHPQYGMIVTNLTRMPLSQLDFGAGSPVDFQVYTQIIPSAAILANPDGVEIRVFLPLQVAQG